MASKFGALHASALVLVIYAFLNSFIIGIQISPDFHLVTLPWSYVTQYTAITTGLLALLGFGQFAYYAAGESGIGRYNLGSVVGLAMGVAGAILAVFVLLYNYQLDDPTFNKYLGGYLFLGSIVILIAYRELIVNFGKAIKTITK